MRARNPNGSPVICYVRASGIENTATKVARSHWSHRSHCQVSQESHQESLPGVTVRSYCQESLPGITYMSHCQESLPGVTYMSHCQESLPGVTDMVTARSQ